MGELETEDGLAAEIAHALSDETALIEHAASPTMRRIFPYQDSRIASARRGLNHHLPGCRAEMAAAPLTHPRAQPMLPVEQSARGFLA